MDRFFRITERGSTVKTEIAAGLTTFFAMAYVVVTGPNQLVGANMEGEFGAVWNAVYIASLLAAVIGTLLYAFYVNLPYVQAAGTGLCSFFFVSFMLPQLVSGGSPIEGYQAGLLVVFLSGVIFLILSITGTRARVARAIPDCLKQAIPVGIGLFIAFIGLKDVGIIQANPYTLVQFADIHGAIGSEEGIISAVPAIVAFLGFILIAILHKRNVKGSIILGVLFSTVLYYLLTWKLPDFNLSQIGQAFRDFSDIGIGACFRAEVWKNVFSAGGIVGGAFNAVMLILTFSLVDMFDTIGTLYGAAAQADMLDEDGDPIDMDKAMAADSVATVSGAVFGTSTCTTFVESAAGVAAGGRTGLTSLTTALCFLLCMVLSPIAGIIPAAGTAPALIFVGVLMLKNVARIDMTDMASAVPGFLAMVMMPLTFSISNGIGISAIAYVLIRICTGKFEKLDSIVAIVAVLFILRFVFITM